VNNAREITTVTARRLAGYLLLYKVCFFFFVACAIELVPNFRMDAFERHTSWPAEGPPTWQSPLATWDGAHYLKIAEKGYEKGDLSCAFYPLWPFLIRVFSVLFWGDLFWSGLVLANLLSVAALMIFHRLVSGLQGVEVANQSLVLLLAFPGAIFLSLIYTEPLFLFLSTAFFLLLFRHCYWWAAVTAFFLPLTKAVGIFAVVPLAAQLWKERRPWPNYLALGAPLLGYGAYFLTMYAWTGNAFEGFEAQKHFPTQPSVGKIFDLGGFLMAFVSVRELHNSTGSFIDRFFFVLLLGLLPWVFRLNPVLGVYTVLIGIVPAVSSGFMSYSRHVVMCFPIFMVLAGAFRGEERAPAFYYMVALLGAVQACFLIRYLNFFWAG
jgi:hypothetical protein